MSAAVATLPSTPGVTWPRTLASEWGKTWGLRSTRWAVAATVVLNAAMCVLTAFDSLVGPEGYGYSLAYLAAGYLLFTQVPLLVHGVLAGAGEFSAGGATSTFAVAPRRLGVLTAKAVTTAGVAAVTGVVTLVTSSLVLLASPFGAALRLGGDEQSVRILLGAVASLVLITVLALAVGALLRRPLVGIAVMVALGLSELALLGADGLAQWLPGHALVVLTSLDDFVALATVGSPVGTWGSLAILGAWALVALVLAGARLRRTDV